MQCSFCSELSHSCDGSNLFLSLVEDYKISTRVIYESNNFVILPTIGAFVEGYLLIVAKQHYISIGAMAQSTLDEFNQMILACKSVIAKIYEKKTLVFEHGGRSDCNTIGACVEHAHVHIVPIKDSIKSELLHYPMQLHEIGSVRRLYEYGERSESYLFYQDIDGINYIIESEIIPSQFMRQVTSHKLGVGDRWDWKLHHEVPNIIATLENIKPEVFESAIRNLRHYS